jgi:hypothetical protein
MLYLRAVVIRLVPLAAAAVVLFQATNPIALEVVLFQATNPIALEVVLDLD